MPAHSTTLLERLKRADREALADAYKAHGRMVYNVCLRVLKDSHAAEDATDGPGRAEAVRGAALFALLLELQGRDEAAITRILDDVIGDAHDTPASEFDTPIDVQRSLDAMRHRLDIALAGEAAS